MKFDTWIFFENLSRRFKFRWNLTIIKGAVLQDLCTFVTMPRLSFLKMRNIQTNVVEKIKTHFMFNFSRTSCRLWDNVLKYGRPDQDTDDSIIRRMPFACCLPKATKTHSEYVIFVAFPRHEWLQERARVLPYTYIACLVTFCVLFTSTTDQNHFERQGNRWKIHIA